MAKAKKIKRQTEKEAKKELKESGELKGKSRSEKKRLIRVAALNKRSYLDDQGVRRSGQKPLEGIMTSRPKAVKTASKASAPVVSKFPDAKQTAENNKRVLSNQKAEDAVKPGETYIRIMKDGTKKRVRKPNIEKMKAIKKAPGGAAMKKMSMYADGGKMPKYKKGGALKEVPSEAKGLSKLPKSVRNKMGYAKHGSKVKAMYGAKMKKK